MGDGTLRPIRGKRAKASMPPEPPEKTVRIVFIPQEGVIYCVDANTHFAYQIQCPIIVTVPESVVGYLRPEAS